jgi:hypothetical protein
MVTLPVIKRLGKHSRLFENLENFSHADVPFRSLAYSPNNQKEFFVDLAKILICNL